MADSAGDERIEELLRQWRESATPRVGLQLAEEYRRTGRHEEACELLEQSLEAHPGHLSSLVALGKARLDLDQAEAAAERFERVLERDPTHLVAGKLLIEAYLRRGDGAAARERLELYRLLNSGDPELDDLERRIGELGSGVGEAAEEAASAEAEQEEPAEVERAPEAEPAPAAAVAPPGIEAPEPERAVEPEPAADAEPGQPPGEARRPAGGEDVEAGTADPFGPLAGGDDERRFLAGLGADGIFGVETPSEPAPDASVAAEPEAPEPPEAPADEEPVEAEEAAGEKPSPPSERQEAAAVEPSPPVAAEAAEPPAPSAVEAPAESQSSIEATRPAAPVERAAPPPVRAVADSAAPAAEPRERATNTLGELYLTQGHLEDAERVFRTVLERRPDDRAAMAGLAEVERRRAARITASDLMRWAASRGHAAETGDRTGRSASMLRAYLARLRDRSSADVP